LFAANSRYAKMQTYAVKLPGGGTVVATRLPVPPGQAPLAGYHTRVQGDRLDLLAARYLQDPTLFWKLCDANQSPVPAALEARPLIGIPLGGH
jgi:hypothetical protein